MSRDLTPEIILFALAALGSLKLDSVSVCVFEYKISKACAVVSFVMPLHPTIPTVNPAVVAVRVMEDPVSLKFGSIIAKGESYSTTAWPSSGSAE